ncbi:TonB-dependent receptor [Asticcacaulis endophyticus]|uniref:TonB-dependent receptor n=1 Tax=Asticcacaulis endophyticus TaxID=1395890 RepID=A0A918Q3E6_9CAUL|nr:TonB-dependent receptor [Asticcacaulis endophyticus]GGZ30961.1 TonB-dependent receptor [Asticcacaulis endophyticus]
MVKVTARALRGRSSRLRALLMVTAAIVWPSVASADDAPDPAASAEEATTVVVTAQRRTTALQKTPIAISAFGTETLGDRNINNVRDLAGQVPNLYVARVSISHTTQTFSLRGIGEADPIQEPVLAVYVDDVYSPRQIGSGIEFVDIERVEVLRGPQGTLYGRNSSAGALRIITRDPDLELRYVSELGYGRFNDIQARGLLSGGISKNWSGSIAYVHRSRDGVTENPTLGHDVNRIDLNSARGKLRYNSGGKLDALLTLNLTRDRSDTRSYIPADQPGGFDRRKSYSEVEPLQHLDAASASLRLNYALSPNLSLKSITAFGGFNLNPVDYENDGEAALIQKNLIHYNDQYATQEVQLNGDYGRLTFTSGLFYLHERFFVKRDGFSRTGSSPTAPVSRLRAHNITTTDAYAVFGEGTFAASDVWSFTLGLRGTSETKSFWFDNKVLDANRNPIAQSIKGEADKTWSAWTPKASVQAQWSDNLLQYLSYSRGFKSGGFDNRATRLDLATLPFNPEKVATYETGLKGGFFGGRLRSNVAVFYNDYEDLQVSFYDPAYVGSRRGNAGKAHSWGVELENSFRVTDRLGINLSGGYLKAVYDEYKGAGGNGVNADGNPLINSPQQSYGAGLTYDLPLGTAGDVKFALNGQYQSNFYASALKRPQDRVPGQGFVNSSIVWQTPNPHVRIALDGRNLTNSDKPVTVSYVPSTGVLHYNFADPATVLVSFRYSL